MRLLKMKENKDNTDNKDEKNNIEIAVVGAGMWGTTLAAVLGNKGYIIKLWVRSREVYDDIKKNNMNCKYTGSNVIHANVIPFLWENKKDSFTNSSVVIFAVPSHVLRDVIKFFFTELRENCEKIKAVVNVAKGLEIKTNKRLSVVMEETLPENLRKKIAVLSGPNIAAEILEGLPSVSVISSSNKKILEYLQSVFSTEFFRIYINSDIAGVEIGAAVKNIIAIAAGISDGLGFGSNTKASLITRGLHELSRIGAFFGANTQTLFGAAGLGDLITTCISRNSRNRMVGERLAKGESIKDIKDNMYMVAEGINTTKSLYTIAKKNNIDLPITESVYNIIYEGLQPLQSVKNLMSRKFKAEAED
ncbi:MAG: NAD(P)-dependent glycerol-3-phosphate dehydrogenase [Actinobacteria bacterium]|nr:NAD(P)-dependent glycerol-3-phosphate dehydrogenase [Actinomycetota bacterium]